jgi:hypothetical protein
VNVVPTYPFGILKFIKEIVRMQLAEGVENRSLPRNHGVSVVNMHNGLCDWTTNEAAQIAELGVRHD